MRLNNAWLDLNMPEYAWIYLNMTASARVFVNLPEWFLFNFCQLYHHVYFSTWLFVFTAFRSYLFSQKSLFSQNTLSYLRCLRKIWVRFCIYRFPPKLPSKFFWHYTYMLLNIKHTIFSNSLIYVRRCIASVFVSSSLRCLI